MVRLDAPQLQRPSTLAPAPSERFVRLLLLEDNPLDAALTTARLRKAGLEPLVTLAPDRPAFERALSEEQFDLILAADALPHFDGMAALRLARQTRPGVPFILISGRVGEEAAIETLQQGATDYVLKHRLERLVPAVTRALKEAAEHTGRVRAQRLFKESEERFRNVIDAVPQLIWVANAEGQILFSNQAWVQRSPGVAHWCNAQLLHPQDYASCLAAWQTALASEPGPFSLEVRFLDRADEPDQPGHAGRWHLLRLTPMQPSAGSPPNALPDWLGTATDIQDRKLNEEALRTAEKLSVTGRMAATIAHEINNPLESLINLIFLARMESQDNPRALHYLDMTGNELERVSSITKQTLQFYRDPLTPVSIDGCDLLEEVLRLFQTRLCAKGITTHFQAQPGIVFHAIKGEIRQVLINLINNAIDAVRKDGHIELAVDLRQPHVDAVGLPPVRTAPHIEITVTDNGTGIAPGDVARLFQPFFSTKGSHGTGLGLWVSKGIVEKHGGTLDLSTTLSTPCPSDPAANTGRRTTARVCLPLSAAAELQKQA